MSLSLPQAEFSHLTLEGSSLAVFNLSLFSCTLGRTKLSEGLKGRDAPFSSLSLASCTLINSPARFDTLRVNESLLEDSPITSLGGDCAINNSTLYGCIMGPALSFNVCTISHSKFADNQGVLGGAISSRSFALIVNSVIHNNTAKRGAGIYSGGVVILESTNIADNLALEAGGGICWDGAYGGALACDPASEVSGNQAPFGAGLAISGGSFAANPDQQKGRLCHVRANAAEGKGGGVGVQFAVADLQTLDVSDNSAQKGGGIYSYFSSLTVMSSTVTNNYGGGVEAENSRVFAQESAFRANTKYGISSPFDLGLLNSSSLITRWVGVTTSGPDSFVCNDCNGKFCAATSSCLDCVRGYGCMVMGTQPVCISSSFECGHGICASMNATKPKCNCELEYEGANCEKHESPAKTYYWIIGFGVGCLAVLIVVIVVIMRFHRRRSEYRPLRKPLLR